MLVAQAKQTVLGGSGLLPWGQVWWAIWFSAIDRWDIPYTMMEIVCNLWNLAMKWLWVKTMYFCSHQQLQLAEWVFIHTQEWGNCRKLKICLADGLPASTKAAGLVYLVYLAGKPKSRPVGALLYVDLWLQNPSGWTKCLGLSGKTLMILLWCCIMLHPFFLHNQNQPILWSFSAAPQPKMAGVHI